MCTIAAAGGRVGRAGGGGYKAISLIGQCQSASPIRLRRGARRVVPALPPEPPLPSPRVAALPIPQLQPAPPPSSCLQCLGRPEHSPPVLMCMVTDAVAAEPGVAPIPPPTAALSLRQLKDILFDTCTGCHQSQVQDDMSAIPYGVLAARAVSANNAKRPDPGRSELAFEDPPLKYNSKLMNSIWGQYNRYSVHNFKKNTDGQFINNNWGIHQQMLITVTAAAPLSGALLNVQ